MVKYCSCTENKRAGRVMSCLHWEGDQLCSLAQQHLVQLPSPVEWDQWSLEFVKLGSLEKSFLQWSKRSHWKPGRLKVKCIWNKILFQALFIIILPELKDDFNQKIRNLVVLHGLTLSFQCSMQKGLLFFVKAWTLSASIHYCQMTSEVESPQLD